MSNKLTNQEKIDEMYEMVHENNEILRSLLRRERFASFMRVLYWIFVFGALFGVYYYLEPVIKEWLPKVQGLQENIERINVISAEMPDVSRLKYLLDILKQQ